MLLPEVEEEEPFSFAGVLDLVNESTKDKLGDGAGTLHVTVDWLPDPENSAEEIPEPTPVLENGSLLLRVRLAFNLPDEFLGDTCSASVLLATLCGMRRETRCRPQR